ncbi:polyprenol monophosphomannose synthase [Sulfuracidifex metallicus]|uniref:polyprenol monophosphomannose synthase n=1 Tax=Sulfuracidifex metallicus TaxID=47303 RepID=UPI0022738F58|nr:polyprenol monophosphomannose synthase [Sulfuracidifex metallicus]MCY0850711.1 polyprenol monophosphomannose synthase [Sulfuracidifex metallicus]
MAKISVVIPTFNEKENIVKLLIRLNEILPSLSFIVVDDNSPDGTEESLKKLNLKNLELIIRKNEKGLGSAIKTGLSRALELESEYIVTMDADFSHDPSYLPSMLEMAKTGYGLVIGSRYVKGGGIENWPLKRRIISKGANFLFRTAMRSYVHDNTSNYRVYSMNAAKEALNCNSADGYEFQICAVFRILKSGIKIGEYPIIFRDREIGKSKLSNVEIFRWFKFLLSLLVSS